MFVLFFQGLPGPDGREGIPGLPGSKVTLTFKRIMERLGVECRFQSPLYQNVLVVLGSSREKWGSR